MIAILVDNKGFQDTRHISKFMPEIRIAVGLKPVWADLHITESILDVTPLQPLTTIAIFKFQKQLSNGILLYQEV